MSKKSKGGLRFNQGGSKSKKREKRAEAKTRVPKKGPERFEPGPEVTEYSREEFIVVGKRPVIEALKSDLQVEKVLILRDNTDHMLKEIADLAREDGLLVQSVEKTRLDTLAEDRPHQGVAALMAPFPYTELDDVLNKVKNEENAIFVILDHITDPFNFGAIIRSAEVLGAQCVIFPQRRSAGLSPAAVKASAGAAAYIPLTKVVNLAQTIEQLKKVGFWIAGADMDGQPYYKSDFKGKIALVLGAEGSGLSPKIEKACDFKVSVPIYGKVESLNVSAAAAILLAEAAKQQHQ